MGKMRSMDYKSFFLILALAFSFQVSADQVEGEKNANIYKDPRLDYLLKVYSLKEPVVIKAKNLYRVQIISTNSREEINEAKAKFASKYPGIPTMMSFNPPNFKLRAGGFTSREDANAFLKEVRKLFPASFIVESHF